MAMGLIGKNKHYHWDTIVRRHFISTASASQFSTEQANIILDTMLEQVEPVIEKTKQHLPNTFPKNIANSIFKGMLDAKRKLL